MNALFTWQLHVPIKWLYHEYGFESVFHAAVKRLLSGHHSFDSWSSLRGMKQTEYGNEKVILQQRALPLRQNKDRRDSVLLEMNK